MYGVQYPDGSSQTFAPVIANKTSESALESIHEGMVSEVEVIYEQGHHTASDPIDMHRGCMTAHI